MSSSMPVGMNLPQTAWVKLNRLQTGVGRFHSFISKWVSAPSPNCECGTLAKTAEHVLITFPIHRKPHVAQALWVWMTKLDAGLTTSLPAFDPGSTAAWGIKRINKLSASFLFVSYLEWMPIQTTTITTEIQL